MNLTGLLQQIGSSFNVQDILENYIYFDPVSHNFQSLSGLASQAGSLKLTIGALISLIFSAICCFYGYRLLRIITSISGFVIGSYLGATIIAPLINVSGPLTYLVPVICGTVLASLAWKIYNVGLCLLAFFLTYSAAQLLIPLTDVPKMIVCAFLGVVAAVAVLFFLRPGLIIFTSVFGGFRLAVILPAAAAYFKFTLPSPVLRVVPLSVLLAAAGILVQFFITGKKR